MESSKNIFEDLKPTDLTKILYLSSQAIPLSYS